MGWTGYILRKELVIGVQIPVSHFNISSFRDEDNIPSSYPDVDKILHHFRKLKKIKIRLIDRHYHYGLTEIDEVTSDLTNWQKTVEEHINEIKKHSRMWHEHKLEIWIYLGLGIYDEAISSGSYTSNGEGSNNDVSQLMDKLNVKRQQFNAILKDELHIKDLPVRTFHSIGKPIYHDY